MDTYLRSPLDFTTEFSSALAAWIDDEFAVIDRANAYGPGYTNEVLGLHDGLDLAVRVVYPPEVATSAGFNCQQGAASTCGRLLATVLEDPALLVAASEYFTSNGFVVVMATGVSVIEAGVRVETPTFAPPPPAPPASSSDELSVTAICLLVSGLAGMTLAVAYVIWSLQGSHTTAGNKDTTDEKVHVSPEGDEPQARAIIVHDKAKVKDASEAAILSLPPSSIFATAESKSLVIHDGSSPRSPTSLLPDDSVAPQAQLQNFLGGALCDSLKLSSKSDC